MYPRRWLAVCFTLSCCLAPPSAAPAQDRDKPILRVDGLMPGGLRTSVTESWGTFDFTVTNFSDQDRTARVLMFYVDRPEAQYGRDVWVPAKSSLRSWMLVGPIPPDEIALNQPERKAHSTGLSLARAREVQTLIYDRTDDQERLILPPGEERIRSRVVPYRKRDSYTCLMLPHQAYPAPYPGSMPPADLLTDEVMTLMRTFRATKELSGVVTNVPFSPLPPTPDGFDGIDHFILAANRIADDPGGLRSLRQWVERGGRLWVMLDMADLDAVAPLLGDALDFQVVDRVSLTDFTLETHLNVPTPIEGQSHRHQTERPIDFVRVLLPKDERPRNTIDGWPVWFSRDLGRGKIVFSTLGARGWHKKREEDDPKSPYPDNFPDLPIAVRALEMLADQFQTAPDDVFRPEAFQQSLRDEIGYQVVNRTTVAVIFAGFLLGTLLLGVVLRRIGRGEVLGWLAPLAALLTAAAFVGLGETSRRPVPPTVAQGQIVDAVAGSPEVTVRGMLAMYRPDPGPAPMGATHGGIFDVDLLGITGQTRRLVSTDGDAWHWENVSLPAGVRFGTFRQALDTPQPIAAVARFGPDGVEGKLSTAPFRDVEDALVRTSSGWSIGRDVAVKLTGKPGDDRRDFTCTSANILPQGQFLDRTVLADLQQRRQNLYRQFLDPEAQEAAKPTGARPGDRSLARKAGARHLEGKNVLLAWAKAIDTHFSLVPEARQVGSALLVVPMTFQRSPAGTRVTVPGPFIPFQSIKDGRPVPLLTPEGNQDTDMRLRFQLPAEVLPLAIERVRLNFRIDAPGRRVRVTASPGGKDERVPLHESVSPLDPIRADVADAAALRLDEEGGLYLNLEMRKTSAPEEKAGGKSRAAAALEEQKWTIHYLEVEVVGKTGP